MSSSEVIAEIESLPTEQQWEVLDYLQRKSFAELPESLRRGMAQALAGEGADMETALKETPPGRR